MKKSNFERGRICRSWTARTALARYGTNHFLVLACRCRGEAARCKSITKQKTASMCTPSRGHIIIQGTDTMRGFEPRSRQHDTGVCSPLHYIGKNSCCQPQESALSVFVSHRGSRHLYFTTRGLVGPFCPRRGRAKEGFFMCRFSALPHGQLSPLKTRAYCYYIRRAVSITRLSLWVAPKCPNVEIPYCLSGFL